MTFSPQLEERFAKMLQAYPEGKKRSAVVPMLIYAQDETGAVTQELIAEVAKRCEVTPLQVDEVVGYYSMLAMVLNVAQRPLEPGSVPFGA